MVSTPLADASGISVSLGTRGAGPRRHIDHNAGTSFLTAPIHRRRTDHTPARTGDLRSSPVLQSILERIVGRLREASGAATCALLQLVPATGALQPTIVAGTPLAFSLAPAAMNPLPSAEPVSIDLPDSGLAGCIRSIPDGGALLVAWNRAADEPDSGIVELAARLVAAAIDQDRAGALDLVTWQCLEAALGDAGEAVFARDASGRLLHVSAPARALLGIDAGSASGRDSLREQAFIRTLDLRDQWGVRIDPTMLPCARLRAGKPAPDLVVSARHHRDGRQWLLLHAEAIRDGDGKISIVLTTLQNFTIVRRHGESHWLRSRITEHLHRRPVDLAAIEHDVAAFLEGTCSIELAGDSARPSDLKANPTQHAGIPPEPDDATTELHLACGHLHSLGPGAPREADPAPVLLSPHAVEILVTGDGEIHGRMTCQREAHRSCFDQEELELLTELAEQIGLALAVSRLRASLHAGERLLVDIGQRLQEAEEAERRRMALSIHDGLAQVAASVCQQLEIIAHRYQPSCDAEGQELKRARDLARRTVREARQLIAGLRPVTLETHGLGTAVCEEIESLRADGWTVRYLDGLNGARFLAEVELDVFRVVQEALCNVRKHAGRTSIDVNLEQRGGVVHFEVRDHGAGFDPSGIEPAATSGSHVGLGGMHERIARLGGTLRIESAPVRGTCVKGDVPV